MLKKVIGAGAAGLLLAGSSVVMAASAHADASSAGCAVYPTADSCTFTANSSAIGYGGVATAGYTLSHQVTDTTGTHTVIDDSSTAPGPFQGTAKLVPGTVYTFSVPNGVGAAGSPQ